MWHMCNYPTCKGVLLQMVKHSTFHWLLRPSACKRWLVQLWQFNLLLTEWVATAECHDSLKRKWQSQSGVWTRTVTETWRWLKVAVTEPDQGWMLEDEKVANHCMNWQQLWKPKVGNDHSLVDCNGERPNISKTCAAHGFTQRFSCTNRRTLAFPEKACNFVTTHGLMIEPQLNHCWQIQFPNLIPDFLDLF